MIDFAFITNTIGREYDWEYGYAPRYKDWNKPGWIPPDVFDWKALSFKTALGEISGEVLAIGSSAMDMNSLRGTKKAINQVKKAVEQAKASGAKVIGLGAATKKLLEKIYPEMVFTVGDTLTSAVVLEDLIEISERCGINLKNPSTKLMIVGAYGLIGTSITMQVQELGGSLILVGPNLNKLKRLNEMIGEKGILINDLTVFSEDVDIIITATNHPRGLLQISDLKRIGRKGILAIDVAQPPNINPKVCRGFGKMLRLDGGMIRNNDIFYDGAQGFINLNQKDAFACLAETMILTILVKLMKINPSDFMKIDFWNLPIINEYAKELGFFRIPFSSYGELISDQRIEAFKEFRSTNSHLGS